MLSPSLFRGSFRPPTFSVNSFLLLLKMTEKTLSNVIFSLCELGSIRRCNANFRLHAWGQKRFSEFLTEVGKRTLREGIRADKHLFPDKFHAKSEHDHSSTNSKLISTPHAKRQFKQPYNKVQLFRSDYRSNDNSRVGGKRKWGFGSKFNHQSSKRSNTEESSSKLACSRTSSS